MATLASDFEQPNLVNIETTTPGPSDPLRVSLGAENQVSVLPLKDCKLLFNGMEFVLFNGVVRLVPQDLANNLSINGYI